MDNRDYRASDFMQQYRCRSFQPALVHHAWTLSDAAASIIAANGRHRKPKLDAVSPGVCTGHVHAPKPACMISTMQLTTGTVVGGKIVVEGDPLPEGAVVTILAREGNETFEVPPELEAELLESIAQAERGETISAEELLERLRRIA